MLSGSSHGCTTTLGGLCLRAAHSAHPRTVLSMSLSRPSQYTYRLASCFILEIPTCVACSYSKTAGRSICGTTTRSILKRTPCETEKGESSSDSLKSAILFWRSASDLVASAIDSAVISVLDTWKIDSQWIVLTSSLILMSMDFLALWSGARERQSTCCMSSAFLHRTS